MPLSSSCQHLAHGGLGWAPSNVCWMSCLSRFVACSNTEPPNLGPLKRILRIFIAAKPSKFPMLVCAGQAEQENISEHAGTGGS